MRHAECKAPHYTEFNPEVKIKLFSDRNKQPEVAFLKKCAKRSFFTDCECKSSDGKKEDNPRGSFSGKQIAD